MSQRILPRLLFELAGDGVGKTYIETFATEQKSALAFMDKGLFSEMREMPAVISGFAIDGRKFTGAEIARIGQATNNLIDNYSFVVPTKIDHFNFNDPAIVRQAIQGYVENFNLLENCKLPIAKPKVFQSRFKTVNVLSAQCCLTKELAAFFDSGQLYGVSIELPYHGTYPDGTRIGPFIKAISFLGNDVPAFPFTRTLQDAKGNKLFVSDLHNVEAFNAFSYNKPGDSKVAENTDPKDPKKEETATSKTYDFDPMPIMEKLDGIRAFCDEVEQLLSDMKEGTDPEADPAASGDYKGKPKNPKEVDTDLQDMAFELLFSARKIRKGDREAFDALCKTKGVKFTKEHYMAQPNVYGPPGGRGEGGIPKSPEIDKTKVPDTTIEEFKAEVKKIGLPKQMEANLIFSAEALAKSGELDEILENVKRYEKTA